MHIFTVLIRQRCRFTAQQWVVLQIEFTVSHIIRIFVIRHLNYAHLSRAIL